MPRMPVPSIDSPFGIAALLWYALVAVTAIYFVTEIYLASKLRQKDLRIKSLEDRLSAMEQPDGE